MAVWLADSDCGVVGLRSGLALSCLTWENNPPAKGNLSRVVTEQSKDENTSWITALETRFSAMERRQDGMEQRVGAIQLR